MQTQAQKIILPGGAAENQLNNKKVELEHIFINYIDNIISNDIALGRNKENFYQQDCSVISRNIDEFRKRGFRIFAGGGNIFILKVEHRLTGWLGICTQIRGLAQRKIIIKEKII